MEKEPTFERNMCIFRDQSRGMKPAELSEKYGLSKPRIGQIISNIERRLKFMVTQKDAGSVNEKYQALVRKHSAIIRREKNDFYKSFNAHNKRISEMFRRMEEEIRQMRYSTFDLPRTLPDDQLEQDGE